MLFKRFRNHIIIYICAFQLILVGVLPPSTFAGQEIELSGSYFADINGNSSASNYATSDLDAFGNHIRVTASTNMNDKSIHGAYITGSIDRSSLYNNQVDIRGGTNLGSVFGGYITWSGYQIIHHNIINILAGEFSGSDTIIAGGFSDSDNNTASVVQDVNYNILNINNGTFTNDNLAIYGAYSQGDDNNSDGGGQNIIGNAVNITSGTFKNTNSSSPYTAAIYGGYARGSSYAELLNVKDNKVNIGGGTFSSDATTHMMEIYGGYVAYVGTNQVVSADVSGNIVSITGGTFGGKNIIICGGATRAGGTVTNNTVIIGGTAVFTADRITLCGGVDYSGMGEVQNRDVYTNNTLKMQTSITITELKNFDKYDFYVPKDMPDGGTMITLDGYDAMPARSASNVRVELAPGNNNLRPGYSVTLVDDIGLNGDISKTFMNYDGVVYGEHLKDIKKHYVFDVTLNEFQFIISLREIEENQQLKSLANGMLGGIATINQGEDIVQDHLASYSDLNFSSAYELKFFNNTKSGSFTQYSNAYRGKPIFQNDKIESDSLMQITGGSYSKYGGIGLTNIGAFYESGASTYKTRDAYDNAYYLNGVGKTSYLNGSGEVVYQGGGIFGRQEIGGAGNSRFYMEAAGRIGRADIDLTIDDWLLPDNHYIEYSMSPMYYGVQGGVGYLWKEKSGKGNKGVKLSARYLQTTLKGESATLTSGSYIEYDDVNSRRLQTGARFSYLPKKWLNTYIGATYEYELDGKVRTAVDGDDLAVSPDIRGSTVIGEVGLVLGKLPITLELSLKGSTGKREDFSTNTELTYDF